MSLLLKRLKQLGKLLSWIFVAIVAYVATVYLSVVFDYKSITKWDVQFQLEANTCLNKFRLDKVIENKNIRGFQDIQRCNEENYLDTRIYGEYIDFRFNLPILKVILEDFDNHKVKVTIDFKKCLKESSENKLLSSLFYYINYWEYKHNAEIYLKINNDLTVSARKMQLDYSGINIKDMPETNIEICKNSTIYEKYE